MKRKLLLQIILILSVLSCFGQFDKSLSYSELEDLALDSFRSSPDTSILIMEYLYDSFPDRFDVTSIILPQMYTRVGRYSEAVNIWEVGVNKGYIYNLNNEALQKYYKENEAFGRLATKEKSILDTLHLKFEVEVPSNYSKTNRYPVLFVFHGNNRNIELSKLNWNSPILKQEFITVYLQSYFPAAPDRFKWYPNDEKIKSEFTDIYEQVLKDYPINTSKIIFSGMSAGGRKALEFTLNSYFPVNGLVLNCPVIPRNISDEMIVDFTKSNKKLGIITGEKDFALESQKELVHNIDSLSGHTKMIVSKDLGHVFAENFSELLDKYLKWVIEEK